MANSINTTTAYDVHALGEAIGDAIFLAGMHEAQALQGKASLKDTILDSILELRHYHISQAGEQHASYVAGCIALFGDGVFNSKGYVAGSVRQSVEAAIAERKKIQYNVFMKARGVTAKKPATEADLLAYVGVSKVLDFEADKVASGLKSALMRARMIYKAVWANPSIVADSKGLYRGLNAIYSDASELVKNGAIAVKQPAQPANDKGATVSSGKPANNKEAFEMLLASESPATVIEWMLELLSLEATYVKKHSLQLKTLEALKAQL